MKRILITIILFNLYSCTVSKSIKTVDCQLNDSKNRRVQISIPAYKSHQVVKSDAEEGAEYVFWYKDSSAVYVSTFKGGTTINYQNIRNTPEAYGNRFLSDSIQGDKELE